ncbi:hypothetical protein [[Eubacterium] cellulosolvens]
MSGVMRIFESIRKVVLNSHVLLFLLALIIAIIFFIILIFIDIQKAEEFIPLFVFFIIWVIAILFIWVIVSFILAYKTKNPRYIFQFIGLIFFIIYPLSFLFSALYLFFIPIEGSWGFPQNEYYIEFIILSCWIGALIMILGYFGPYHGKILRNSRNIIVREGKKISEMTDGYSNRPYSKNFEEIKELDNSKFIEVSRKFAKNLAHQGIILDWKLHDGKLEIIPMKQLTSDPDFFITNFLQVLKLIFKKKNMSKITFFINGNVTALISEKEYNEIKAPVAYHTLCNNVVAIFATAFIEFSKNNYIGFNQVFVYGPGYDYRTLRGSSYPKYLKWDKEDKNSALWFVALIVAPGLTSYCLADFIPTSPVNPQSMIPINTILVVSVVIFLLYIEHRLRKVKY